MISVKWDPKAIEFLDKLNKNDAERIVKKVDKIKENPLRYVQNLVNQDFGKVRIGNYRLFVDFIVKEEKFIIRTIKNRKNAYKK